MAKNLFVVGLDGFNRGKLEALPEAAECAFHGLLDPADFVDTSGFPVTELLERARRALAAFPGPVDGVIGYMDFPVSTMLPVLCRELGLPSPSLESVLRCEHKYWSRLEQSRVVPEHIPRFRLVDPFAADPGRDLDLGYPFWLKPVKSFGSHLGFRIRGPGDWARALREIRATLPRLAEPFDQILRLADLPAELAGVSGRFCLAEEIVGGRQCTLEGSVLAGGCRVHGAVDSIRYPNRSSFLRYEYPSRLPGRVRTRMEAVVARFLARIGLDRAAFNAELFWDRPRDRIWLLEVNTRIAQHHSDLFEKVDGVSNHQVPVRLALGREPAFPRGGGRFRRAAVFFLRRFRDGVVTAVPDAEAVARLERLYSGTVIKLQVTPGVRLSALVEQDSYSYILALIYVGAGSRRELLQRYRQVAEPLGAGFAFREGGSDDAPDR